MKKTDADTIVWSNYDKDFVDWLFFIYETVDKMPPKGIIEFMAEAFYAGRKQGWTAGYTTAREDCW